MTRPAGGAADSAGVPWEGRRFEPNPSAADDGRADAGLAEALVRFRAGEAGQSVVVDALRRARVLVPLVAHEGDGSGPGEHTGGAGAHGLRAEHSQELALVEVAAPDGRRVLPAFSSVATLAEWNPAARPVPVGGRRLALAAAGEGTELVVLDPGSSGGFALRRGAIRAIATESPWLHPADDPRVVAVVERTIADHRDVLAARALPGDPEARLTGPEVIVAVVLASGLAAERRRSVRDALADEWSRDAVLIELADSLAVTVIED